jgi:hypothetical protein
MMPWYHFLFTVFFNNDTNTRIYQKCTKQINDPIKLLKKLRIEEFPQVLDLHFKCDDDDPFTVAIDQAFMI